MESERSFQLQLSTTVYVDRVESSQLIVEKTFSRKKAQVKQAKVPNGHRSVGLFCFVNAHSDLLAEGHSVPKRGWLLIDIHTRVVSRTLAELTQPRDKVPGPEGAAKQLQHCIKAPRVLKQTHLDLGQVLKLDSYKMAV